MICKPSGLFHYFLWLHQVQILCCSSWLMWG